MTVNTITHYGKPFTLAFLLVATYGLLTGCGSGAASTTPTAVGPRDSPAIYPTNPSPTNPSEPAPTNPIPSEATSFYFTYDESGSTAARDLTFAALSNHQKPNSAWGRPYEYLNAEHFEHFDLTPAAPFNVSMGLYKAQANELPTNRNYTGMLYALGINLTGPLLTQTERPNVVLTLLVDVSGSMDSKYAQNTSNTSEVSSRLDVVKTGVSTLLNHLKEGDVLNLVTFEYSAKTIISHWVYSPDDRSFYNAAAQLEANGSTNVDAGVELAYKIANETYDPAKANRVIILTDANANTGETAAHIIAQHTVINGTEGIYFAGIGIGENFNDNFLNTLTDIGKSTYSAMITPADAERIFAEDFMRFLAPAVRDVKFQITYPSGMKSFYSAAEETSTNANNIQSVNFSYNSEQFFLELFTSARPVDTEQVITFTITYTNDQGEPQRQHITKTIGSLLNQGEDEIKSAAAVTALAQLVAGAMTCSNVKSSSLYTQDIRTYAFEKYKQGIKDFCQ